MLGGGILFARYGRVKGHTAVLVKSAKEFQILQTASMHKRAKQVNGDVQAMAHRHNHNKQFAINQGQITGTGLCLRIFGVSVGRK